MAADMALDFVVIPGHTRGMKCAISVPDEVFAAVDEQAARLGISRSEFFAIAAERYINDLTLDERVAALNEVLDAIGVYGPDEDTDWILPAGRRFLAQVEWNDRGDS